MERVRIKTSVMIYKDQHEWIKNKKSLNFSGLIRELLDKLIDAEGGKGAKKK